MNYIIREIELSKLSGDSLPVKIMSLIYFFERKFKEVTEVEIIDEDNFILHTGDPLGEERLIRQENGIMWCEYTGFWDELTYIYNQEEIGEFMKYFVKEFFNIDAIGMPIGSTFQRNIEYPGLILRPHKIRIAEPRSTPSLRSWSGGISINYPSSVTVMMKAKCPFIMVKGPTV